VLNFADRPRIDVPFTSDAGVLAARIARVDSIGGTAMRDAVAMADTYLREHASRDRRVLLIVTDGRDNASTTTWRQLDELTRHSQTVVYAIGLFGSDAAAHEGRHELDRLTEHSGGTAFYPAAVDEVDAVVGDLARRIRNQYTIGYAPTNPTLDGSYRRIRVEARAGEPLKVWTRAGYVALP
jgi:Ca-activated chloride channel family protein